MDQLLENAKAFVSRKLAEVGESPTKGAVIAVEASIEAAWLGITYEQVCAERKINANSLKGSTAPKLWRTLSRIAGYRVSKGSFKQFYLTTLEKNQAESLEGSVEASALTVGAVLSNRENFYGRTGDVPLDMDEQLAHVKEFVSQRLAEVYESMTEGQEVAVEAAWLGVPYDQAIAGRNVNSHTLKKGTAPKLWKTLSEIAGHNVTKGSFKQFYLATLEKSQAESLKAESIEGSLEASAPTLPTVEVALPNIDNIYGRAGGVPLNMDEQLSNVKEFVSQRLAEVYENMTDEREAAIEAAWRDITYDQVSAERNVSKNNLKVHVAPALWQTLSRIVGQKVSKRSFRDFYLEALEKNQAESLIQAESIGNSVKASAPTLPTVGAALPNIENFYGRTEELNALETLLQRCKCISIVGPEGIGKKSLVAKLLCTADLPFSQAVWKPLHHKPTADELEFELRTLLNENADRSLLSYLKDKKVLIVLESIDVAIAGRDHPGELDPQYMSLIRRIAEETRSRLIILSNEPINQIKAQVLRGRATIYPLHGLTLEAAKAFVKNALGDKTEEIWQAVGGNPMMLKEIANWAEYAKEIDPLLAHRLTVHKGLLKGFHERAFAHSLSTVDRQLLTFVAQEGEVSFASLLSQRLDAAPKIQRLIDMGLFQKKSSANGGGIKINEFFRQFLIEQSANPI